MIKNLHRFSLKPLQINYTNQLVIVTNRKELLKLFTKIKHKIATTKHEWSSPFPATNSTNKNVSSAIQGKKQSIKNHLYERNKNEKKNPKKS